MKLYELSDAYRTLSNLCEEGEDFQESLEQIQDEFSTKVENVAKVIRELEAHKDVYAVEMKRLGERAQTIGNNIVGLKTYLQANMESAGVDKVKGQILSVRIQKSPPSCEVIDVNNVPSNLRTTLLKIPSKDVPEEMLHYKTDETVDKKTVIELWEAKTDVPGTQVKQGKHLRIW